MEFEKEIGVFENYIVSRGLKRSEQRVKILEVFLKSKRHLTADELYRMVTKKFPKIGYATIYRTLKLLCESGACREMRLDDGITRYEALCSGGHHDHLICMKCGKFTEVVNDELETLQEKIAESEGFTLVKYRLEMYGICGDCRKKRK